MNVFLLYTCVMFWNIANALRRPRVSYLPPGWIIFRLRDDGYDLVTLKYDINKPVLSVTGRWNVDFNKTGNAWIYKKKHSNLGPGDTVYYSVFAKIFPSKNIPYGNTEELLNEAYTIRDRNRPRGGPKPGKGVKDPMNSDEYRDKIWSTTPDTDTDDDDESDHVDYGLIGAVTGIILVISLVILIVVCICRKRRNRRHGNKNKSGTKPVNKDNILQSKAEINKGFSDTQIPKNTSVSTKDRDTEVVYDYIRDDDLSKGSYEVLARNGESISKETQEYDKLQEKPVTYLELVG